MKPALTLFHVAVLLALVVPAGTWAQAPQVRPGKGMDMIPGDFAEYSNTEYVDGKPATMPSTIMVSTGQAGTHQGVMIIMARGDELVSSRMVHYDLSKARPKEGQVEAEGKASLTISGESYECTWEKRKIGDVTVTSWISPELPFEKYAKVEVVYADGKKRVTELTFFGPNALEAEKATAFNVRLKRLSEQAASKGGR